MWLLRSEENEKLIYLKPNATMTVGRNKGDIVLADDKSISRVHAHIIVKSLLDVDKITEKTQPLSTCIIKDSGSKYGNFLLKDDGPIRISEEGLNLNHMDRIRFGLQTNIFTVHYIPLITVTSGMSEVEKEKLKKIVAAVDGRMTYIWTPLCTHMTVVKPTISEKLSCALATLTPIVSFDYWDSVTKAFEENKEFPDPADFAHTIDNQMQVIGNVSVRPNPARKTLFQNLTFVHFTHKQFILYSRMIKYAGGKSVQYGKQRPPPDVSDENVIVVQFVESNTTQATGTGDASYDIVCNKLRECRRRTIPESEIPIALLHCSTSKYCNPRFDYAVLFAPKKTENSAEDMEVLAMDTQDLLGPSTSRESQVDRPKNAAFIVPETVQESCDMESYPVNEHSKNRFNNWNSAEAKYPESVENLPLEASPSESEIGSMKLASFNYEDHLREELNKKTLTDKDSMKRHRDSEDVSSEERKKKICLGVSSIDKAKERDYENLMPDDDDDILLDKSVEELEKERPSLNAEGHRKKMIDRKNVIDEMVMKVDRDNDDDRSETTRKRSNRDLSPIDMPKKNHYNDILDHDDEFLLNKPSSIAAKAMEQKQRLGTSAKLSASEKNVQDSATLKKNKITKAIDSVGNRMIGSGEIKSSEHSTDEEQENSSKRKVVKSDISPFSECTENPRKRMKSGISDEEETDSKMKKPSSDKRPLMDLKPSPNLCEAEIKVEVNWILNNSNGYGSERDISGASDVSSNSLDRRGIHTTDFIRFPNDPNETLHPLLRIRSPSDVQTKNTKKFGKCFRKQKINIPTRIELDGWGYCAWTHKLKPKQRLAVSLDTDD